jgi:7,8-dihydropterin-6-yl-methyl-4-(beta-D-ribofuranosyl)aminobenzene 5'-phosphate synthase
VSIVVQILFIFGLLLILGTGCSPPTNTLGKVSPTDTTSIISVTETYAPIPTKGVQENGDNPTPIGASSVATEAEEEAMGIPMKVTEALTITIVYDNNAYDERLQSAWGFSALVAYHDHRLLFDTGGEGPLLMNNIRILGIDPSQIESIVLSHAHGDHTGGLSALLESGARPIVYLLPSFPAAFKNQLAKTTEVIDVTPGLLIVDGMFTTGELGRSIPEQALVIQTDRGLVIITGCAHPGIVDIVKQAQTKFNGSVHLVIGGFHLGSKSNAQIAAILRDFRRLGVERVAPCHCTGDNAIAMFAKEYGEDFIQAGAGKVITVDTKILR